MKVLVACEYSGIVRDAFKDKGHEAWSCDILSSENGGNHIQDDVLNHLDEGWDLMIAHPPCTYLSKAGARWLYPKAGQLNQDRYNLGIKGKEFFMRMIDADIDKIASLTMPEYSQATNTFIMYFFLQCILQNYLPDYEDKHPTICQDLSIFVLQILSCIHLVCASIF